MAIRPEMRDIYPANWKQISRDTISKRGNKCEICGIAPRPGLWLTTHHRDRNPANCEDSNLLVCCPRHHFQQEALINAGHQFPGQLDLFSDLREAHPKHNMSS